MTTEGAPRRKGPVALSALFDDALQHLQPAQGSPRGATPASDGFLYSGNRHESVPRALLLDRRLTPLERNAWQVFRLLLNDDGVTAFPTYDQLRPYLTSTPCAEQASHETVSRALTLLRLTRWLSLVRRRRAPTTGRILGNLYVLHDEPLTPFEAMQLDPEYLGLVSHALNHASKAIQRVGYHAIQELTEDPMLCGHTLPTRLQVLAQRMAQGGMSARESYPQTQPVHESEVGLDTLLRNGEPLPADSEAGAKANKTNSLRNPKKDRTVSNRINRTVPRARELQDLRLPERFLALKDEQQAGALVALQQIESEQRQAVLDEWDVRCRDSHVRKPAGYLFGVIQKALRGEFNAWAAQGLNDATVPPPTPTPRPANPEVVQAHLAHLHALLNRR
ncbi:STY4528 family pathogenicity island replication protein [Pseudomonas aeruginosa]|uniref:STY4528 family pathogenicity island replication protein n=1 Tax=Pseudomonas aeruginosa TaxID=287 RepID=UPI002B4921AC|nr:STY4528 family pathogenicity island replication protein [Pseudomonas aeruginosa]MEB3080619.1 STY4528 family pathogenicity island replication protein [Pseudomonas aeruginosa]MEB3142450.1 STY4528 family pathogenicity island replication protein [Pseudomonas aeruginosa]